MNKPLKVLTFLLCLLLAIRIAGQIFAVIISTNAIYTTVSLVFGLIYLISFIGILLHQKWAVTTIGVVAVLDLLFALGLGGAKGIGAGVVDLALLYLAVKEYHYIHREPHHTTHHVRK